MRTPERVLGRANASMGFLAQAIGPVGALLAGGLGEVIGPRLTLLVAVLGGILTAIWLLTSPLRELTAHPEAIGD